MGSADHRLLLGERGPRGFGANKLGDAKVGDLHPALLVEQDVLRLDVAVDDALLVRELQRLANLRHNGQRLLRAPACAPCSNCRSVTPSTYSISK